MIVSQAMDVEITPNFFSVTFVNMQSYMDVFRDCDAKPLTECLTVKEIKERLDSVKSDIFYITDTDDSQLLKLASYINSMHPYFKTETSPMGECYQVPYRTDLYGFNNAAYDDVMLKGFMSKFNLFKSSKELITWLYELSKKIIRLQNDKEAYYADEELKMIRLYKLPYTTVDVQQVYGLHTAGVMVDKDGNRNKYGKSLKQTSINLKWHELLDFKLPPIDEEEAEYYREKDEFRGASLAYLNAMFENDFDRYILPKYITPMCYYNKNDVFIVCEICRQKPDEIKLRYSITAAFGVNVLCSARANIADKLTTKFYANISNQSDKDFINGRTERHKLSFNKIIFPHIQFKTKQLQDLLTEMKTVSIYHTNSESFKREFDFMGTTYTVATGGIHSQDPPRICVSNDEYVYLHHDYTSYYPSIMISYGIAPEHLNKDAFIKLLTFLKETRVKCKHTKDSEGYVMAGVPNKIGAEALKIVINSIYGKLGSELFFLYDRLAQMKVTINGQLMTLTLIEELELNGIHVISANTDGIVIKLSRDKFGDYKRITDAWNITNKMGADYEEYDRIISRDINNYFDIQTNGTVEYKGALDPKQYIKDLKKGYDAPIVPIAVFNYFVNNTPIMETLTKHKFILDFCKTQNVGKQFEVITTKVVDGKFVEEVSQRHTRYYISNSGVILHKENKATKKRTSLVSGYYLNILNSLDDTPIENRNINYKYYYDECYKIINTIKLGISPNASSNKDKGISSGKKRIDKYAGCYKTLFDDSDLTN